MGVIAELFVKIGLTGGDKVAKDLESTEKGMSEVASSGLAAKAAIVGMVYGLEQMMSASAKTGNTLVNLGALLDLPPKELQQWGNAFRASGSSAEAFQASVTGLSNSLATMRAGGAVPSGYWMLGISQGEKNPLTILKAARDAAKKYQTGDANFQLHSMGIGDEFISRARLGKLDDKVLSGMDYQGEKTLKTLDHVNEGLNKIAIKRDQAMGGIVARNGLEAVKDIGLLNDMFIRAERNMERFISRSKEFAVLKFGLHALLGGTSFAIKDAGLGGPADPNSPYERFKKWFEGNVSQKGGPLEGSKIVTKELLSAALENNIPNFAQTTMSGETNVVNNFTINGVEDPEAVAEAVEAHLSTHYSRTKEQTSRGR